MDTRINVTRLTLSSLKGRDAIPTRDKRLIAVALESAFENADMSVIIRF